MGGVETYREREDVEMICSNCGNPANKLPSFSFAFKASNSIRVQGRLDSPICDECARRNPMWFVNEDFWIQVTEFYKQFRYPEPERKTLEVNFVDVPYNPFEWLA